MASKEAHRAMKKFQKSPVFIYFLIFAVIVALVKWIFGI